MYVSIHARTSTYTKKGSSSPPSFHNCRTRPPLQTHLKLDTCVLPSEQLTIGDGIAAVEAMAAGGGGTPVDQPRGVADATKEEGEEEEASRKEGKERRRIQVLVIDADSDDTT